MSRSVHAPDPKEEGAPEEAPDEAPEESPRTSFPCANCGAETRWDPEADALACEYCGHKRPVPRAEGLILERPLSDAGDAARGLGLAVRVAICKICGARVSFDEKSTSKLCVYCGSPNILVQEANRNAIRPESLVPLDVGRKVAEENFRRWLQSRWFRPEALKRQQRFEARGVYVPFWTFDCQVHSEWTADAGHYYWVSESYWTMVNGRRVRQTRQVRKVRWVPAGGRRADAFDDLLINASVGTPRKLLAKLGAFNTQGLVPYRPEYLAGWHAEEYQVDLEQASKEALALVEVRQRERCAGDVPGDTQRNLRVQNTISELHWKHVLLPIWSFAYQYQGKPYAVLVHGETGSVSGEAPLSWAKILLLVLVLLALLGMVLLGFAIAGASG